MIERTPPDVRSEILKSGIYLTGGLARSHGLPAYLRQSTGLLVTAHKNPELCAVKGLRTIIPINITETWHTRCQMKIIGG